MRNPKFRAYDTKNKKFPFIGFHIMGEVSCFDLLKQYRLEEWDDIKISEWTGLVDKNGIDIYEGDEVRCSGGKFKERWDKFSNQEMVAEGAVKFYKGCFGCGDFPLFDYGELEVIGNIFENKELI